MRLKRFAMGSAGAILLAGLTSFAAWGATPPSLRVIPNPTPTGQHPTAYGSGFCSAGCSAVRITAGGEQIADGIPVGADGTFAHQFTVTLSPGQYLVVASQTDATGATLQATTGMTVVPNDATAPTQPAPTPAATSAHASPAASTRPPSPAGTSQTVSPPPAGTPGTPSSVTGLLVPPTSTAATGTVGAARPAAGHGRLPWILGAVVLLAAAGGALGFRLRSARQG